MRRGNLKNLQKENKNPCAWIVGKWLRLPLVPTELARVTNKNVVFKKGRFIKASGMAILLHVHWR